MSCFFGCKFDGSVVLAKAEIPEHSIYPHHKFIATMPPERHRSTIGGGE